jgi:hypothetical protein
MSEFSSSYHIRTDDGREVLKALRTAKVSGITFGPANGWLSFVPYENSPPYRNADELRFAEKLSRISGRVVLHYRFAEDHGWTFALARPGAPPVEFCCWWDPQPTVERDKFDPATFAPFVAPELLEPHLQSFDHEAASEAQPARRFAELLGLPAYAWLSPELAQNHTQDLLDQGGQKLGTKPPGTAERLRVPPGRQLSLPQPLVTAREALELIVPFMARFKPPWRLAMLASNGVLKPDGRGAWMARWRHGDGTDTIQASLHTGGRLAFHADSAPAHMADYLPGPLDLPENWIDSTDVAAKVAQMPAPEGLVQPHLGMIALKSFKDHPHVWEASFNCDPYGGGTFASWTVDFDAASGELIAERLGRRERHWIVPARVRYKGGDWQDASS